MAGRREVGAAGVFMTAKVSAPASASQPPMVGSASV